MVFGKYRYEERYASYKNPTLIILLISSKCINSSSFITQRGPLPLPTIVGYQQRHRDGKGLIYKIASPPVNTYSTCTSPLIKYFVCGKPSTWEISRSGSIKGILHRRMVAIGEIENVFMEYPRRINCGFRGVSMQQIELD